MEGSTKWSIGDATLVGPPWATGHKPKHSVLGHRHSRCKSTANLHLESWQLSQVSESLQPPTKPRPLSASGPVAIQLIEHCKPKLNRRKWEGPRASDEGRPRVQWGRTSAKPVGQSKRQRQSAHQGAPGHQSASVELDTEALPDLTTLAAFCKATTKRRFHALSACHSVHIGRRVSPGAKAESCACCSVFSSGTLKRFRKFDTRVGLGLQFASWKRKDLSSNCWENKFSCHAERTACPSYVWQHGRETVFEALDKALQ